MSQQIPTPLDNKCKVSSVWAGHRTLQICKTLVWVPLASPCMGLEALHACSSQINEQSSTTTFFTFLQFSHGQSYKSIKHCCLILKCYTPSYCTTTHSPPLPPPSSQTLDCPKPTYPCCLSSLGSHIALATYKFTQTPSSVHLAEAGHQLGLPTTHHSEILHTHTYAKTHHTAAHFDMSNKGHIVYNLTAPTTHPHTQAETQWRTTSQEPEMKAQLYCLLHC